MGPLTLWYAAKHAYTALVTPVMEPEEDVWIQYKSQQLDKVCNQW